LNYWINRLPTTELEEEAVTDRHTGTIDIVLIPIGKHPTNILREHRIDKLLLQRDVSRESKTETETKSIGTTTTAKPNCTMSSNDSSNYRGRSPFHRSGGEATEEEAKVTAKGEEETDTMESPTRAAAGTTPPLPPRNTSLPHKPMATLPMLHTPP
jgi:hypothetical protein